MEQAEESRTGRRIAFGMLALAVVAGLIVLAVVAQMVGSWLH